MAKGDYVRFVLTTLKNEKTDTLNAYQKNYYISTYTLDYVSN